MNLERGHHSIGLPTLFCKLLSFLRIIRLSLITGKQFGLLNLYLLPIHNNLIFRFTRLCRLVCALACIILMLRRFCLLWRVLRLFGWLIVLAEISCFGERGKLLVLTHTAEFGIIEGIILFGCRVLCSLCLGLCLRLFLCILRLCGRCIYHGLLNSLVHCNHSLCLI